MKIVDVKYMWVKTCTCDGIMALIDRIENINSKALKVFFIEYNGGDLVDLHYNQQSKSI